jgi:2,3,4,5-tetrahydropyridine-2-carboxylate N-succinyltransferase
MREPGQKRRLAASVILTHSTPVYDLVKETIHRSEDSGPLVISEEPVVVPGSPAVTQGQRKR